VLVVLIKCFICLSCLAGAGRRDFCPRYRRTPTTPRSCAFVSDHARPTCTLPAASTCSVVLLHFVVDWHTRLPQRQPRGSFTPDDLRCGAVRCVTVPGVARCFASSKGALADHFYGVVRWLRYIAHSAYTAAWRVRHRTAPQRNATHTVWTDRT